MCLDTGLLLGEHELTALGGFGLLGPGKVHVAPMCSWAATEVQGMRGLLRKHGAQLLQQKHAVTGLRSALVAQHARRRLTGCRPA